MNKLKNNIFLLTLFAVTSAILIYICYDLIVLDPILTRDDSIYIKYAGTKSLWVFIEGWFTGKEGALGSVLITSYKFNFFLNKLFGISTFHLINFIFFYVFLAFVYLMFRQLKLKYTEPFIMLLALHPTLLTMVFWIDARKHLFSATFAIIFVLCILKFLDKKKYLFLIIGALAYFLSIFSHIVNFPTIFLGIYLLREHLFVKKDKKVILFFVLLFLLFIYYMFLSYYFTHYYHLNDNEFVRRFKHKGNQLKFHWAPGVSFLGLGRVAVQIFMPIKHAAQYYVGSYLNMVGIILWILYCAISVKVLKKRSIFNLILYHTPLVVMFTMVSNIFVTNRHLILPIVAAFLFTLMIIQDNGFIERHKKKFITLYFIIFIIFAERSYVWSKAWQSDVSLWEHSYQTEKTPRTLAVYGHLLLEQERFKESLAIALQLVYWDKDIYGLDYLLGRSMYMSKGIDTENKIELLKEYKIDKPWIHYHIGILFASMGQWDKAYSYAKKCIGEKEYFHKEYDSVIKDIKRICKLGKLTCREINE